MKKKMIPRKFYVLGTETFSSLEDPMSEKYSLEMTKWAEEYYSKDMVSEEEDQLQMKICASQIYDILMNTRADAVYFALRDFFIGRDSEHKSERFIRNMRQLLKMCEKEVGKNCIYAAAVESSQHDLTYDDYKESTLSPSDGNISGADWYINLKKSQEFSKQKKLEEDKKDAEERFPCCQNKRTSGHHLTCLQKDLELGFVNRFVKHYPHSDNDETEDDVLNFNTFDELSPFIHHWTETTGFYRFSFNESKHFNNHLMAEFDFGYKWWVVGSLRTNVGLDLPLWKPKYKDSQILPQTLQEL